MVTAAPRAPSLRSLSRRLRAEFNEFTGCQQRPAFIRSPAFARVWLSVSHIPSVYKQARTRENSMTRYLILGIICMLSALVLSCVAGMYAAINSNVAIATACTACLALVVGVKWVAGSR